MRSFSVAECFGVIWLETLEEISISEDEQAAVYDELIHWAKHDLFAEIKPPFTGELVDRH